LTWHANMDILFVSRKLHKACADDKERVRTFGPRRAGLIRRRLDDIHAADNLEVLYSLPGPRCHQLSGNRDEQLSVDLDHPYRLIFVPADDPIPRRADGGLDRAQITMVKILGVVDTHE
jgi:plasmid maintenance system killer protein